MKEDPLTHMFISSENKVELFIKLVKPGHVWMELNAKQYNNKNLFGSCKKLKTGMATLGCVHGHIIYGKSGGLGEQA